MPIDTYRCQWTWLHEWLRLWHDVLLIRFWGMDLNKIETQLKKKKKKKKRTQKFFAKILIILVGPQCVNVVSSFLGHDTKSHGLSRNNKKKRPLHFYQVISYLNILGSLGTGVGRSTSRRDYFEYMFEINPWSGLSGNVQKLRKVWHSVIFLGCDHNQTMKPEPLGKVFRVNIFVYAQLNFQF